MILNKVVPTQGKSLFYPNDGTGRDTYIIVNSGGFFAPKQISKHDLGTFPHKRTFVERGPRMDGKAIIYQSDGSGRDSYVVYIKSEINLEDFINIVKNIKLIIHFKEI